ncbi:MAG: ATP-dependent DNA helicase RecG [Chloroflexi bacterium]|nr:ATP-dependent DNA helicase RecG [Chloroflexota bacterium]
MATSSKSAPTTGKNPKLEALAKMLLQERDNGWQDTTVMGGLDEFLKRWASDLTPALGEHPSYTDLSPEERVKWADVAMKKMGLASIGKGKSTTSGKSRPAAKPASDKKPPSPRSATAKVDLDDDIMALHSVTKRNVARLKRLGMNTVRDLVFHFPHRHNDFARLRKVADLVPGEDQTVSVTVWEATQTGHPKRKSTQAILGDDTGNFKALWFNQPYLAKTLASGSQVVISGRPEIYQGQIVFKSPEYELLRGQEELVHTGRLVPVYFSTVGLPQRTLRRVVKEAVDSCLGQVHEFLPQDMLTRAGLMGLSKAISQMHYPDSASELQPARRRLAYDELFMLQLAVISRRQSWQEAGRALPLDAASKGLDAFLNSLPYNLTGAQQRVLGEISSDIAKDWPMSRLIQGDVGSGKTVVATAALLAAVFSGQQGAFMAPTEILAEQHFITLAALLSGSGAGEEGQNPITIPANPLPRPVTIGLLLGSLRKKDKERMHQLIAEGDVDIVIGTQALIQDAVDIPNLALIVVDEQHRFGVIQRASLREKGVRPHVLAMSATPIPRSLALTLYGDLDVSAIDELPPGRQPIRTKWVEPEKRNAAYGFIRKQVEEGRQAFIVCPLIDESESVQARAATVEFQRLSTIVFSDLRLGLLHGRISLAEKEQIMNTFKAGDLDILVSTPVIEVGIDVPNASVMLVDGSDRFGLSQLHQFRGRVGRGKHQSYCLLLSDSPGAEARERLKIVERISDGFQLAEEDLRLRGPGDYLGTRQSGLPDMKVARITDQDILMLARQEAIQLLEADPDLADGKHKALAERFHEYFAGVSGEMS